MADIELVIKIPEELISEIDDENYQSVISWFDTTLYCAIKNGVALPKGHGELIDRDKIECLKAIHDAKYGHISWSDAIKKIKYSAPTIIKADIPKRRKGTPIEENDSGYNCENWIP